MSSCVLFIHQMSSVTFYSISLLLRPSMHVCLQQESRFSQVSMDSGFEPWSMKRTSILSTYTTSETIPITTVRGVWLLGRVSVLGIEGIRKEVYHLVQIYYWISSNFSDWNFMFCAYTCICLLFLAGFWRVCNCVHINLLYVSELAVPLCVISGCTTVIVAYIFTICISEFLV